MGGKASTTRVRRPISPAVSDTPQPAVTFGGDRKTGGDGPIVAGVVVLGALIAIPAFLGIIGSISLSFGRATSGSAFAGMIDLAYLALGVGLILRRERARRFYVALGVLGLVVLAIGFAADLALAASSRGGERAATEAAYTRQKVGRPPEQVREIEAQERAELARLSVPRPGPKPARYVPALLLILVPLLFLTRPSVRRVFS